MKESFTVLPHNEARWFFYRDHVVNVNSTTNVNLKKRVSGQTLSFVIPSATVDNEI